MSLSCSSGQRARPTSLPLPHQHAVLCSSAAWRELGPVNPHNCSIKQKLFLSCLPARRTSAIWRKLGSVHLSARLRLLCDKSAKITEPRAAHKRASEPRALSYRGAIAKVHGKTAHAGPGELDKKLRNQARGTHATRNVSSFPKRSFSKGSQRA